MSTQLVAVNMVFLQFQTNTHTVQCTIVLTWKLDQHVPEQRFVLNTLLINYTVSRNDIN